MVKAADDGHVVRLMEGSRIIGGERGVWTDFQVIGVYLFTPEI